MDNLNPVVNGPVKNDVVLDYEAAQFGRQVFTAEAYAGAVGESLPACTQDAVGKTVCVPSAVLGDV